MQKRLIGIDVARTIALLGMILVNFKLVLSTGEPAEVSIPLYALLEGRASVLFVIIAGVVASMSTKGISALHCRKWINVNLAKRGMILLLIGLLFLPIWEADILHYYGVYFILGASAIQFSSRRLIGLLVVTTLLFPLSIIYWDYGQGWDWETLSIVDLFTVNGLVRSTFFNGYHPVIPWFAFFGLGILIGRLDLTCKRVCKRLLFYSVTMLTTTELSMALLRYLIVNEHLFTMSIEEVNFWLTISILPPLPHYVVSAASSGVFIFTLCLWLGHNLANSNVLLWLESTGRMALTHYFLHVILGMGMLEAFGLLGSSSLLFTTIYGVGYCTLSVLVSHFWLKKYKFGPAEAIFRRLTK